MSYVGACVKIIPDAGIKTLIYILGSVLGVSSMHDLLIAFVFFGMIVIPAVVTVRGSDDDLADDLTESAGD